MLLNSVLIPIDHSGGIVKQPKEHKQGDQPDGSGMTVYYLVEDLKEVSCRQLQFRIRTDCNT